MRVAVDLPMTPKQSFLINDLAGVDEVFYGGQAGGAKSEGLLLFSLMSRLRHAGSIGLMLRRTFPELDKSLVRKSFRYFPQFAKWVEAKRQWRFRNGSIQEFGYCESERDVYQYQSAEYDDIGFDELTHFTEFQYVYLQSRLRPQGKGVLKGLMRSASNPGNIGHGWVRDRFVIPAKNTIHTDEFGITRYFLPATLADNTLMSQAERRNYSRWLSGLPERERKQLMEGDWEYASGVAFAELRKDTHGIDPANPPAHLAEVFDFERMTPKPGIKIFRSMDWGYAKPFSVLWAFSDYSGRVYVYRELYGCKGPDEGIQMPAREVARRIHEIEREHGEVIRLSVADASIWDKPGNQNEQAERLPSIAETMAEEKVWFDREVSILAKKSRLQGKHQIHERLRTDADSKPNLSLFTSCVHTWRTLSALPVDSLNPEDVDTDAEDHCYDALRYMCAARPFKSTIPRPETVPHSVAWFYKQMDDRKRYAHI